MTQEKKSLISIHDLWEKYISKEKLTTYSNFILSVFGNTVLKCKRYVLEVITDLPYIIFHSFIPFLPPAHEVYRGYIVFVFSVIMCVCVCVCVCV